MHRDLFDQYIAIYGALNLEQGISPVGFLRILMALRRKGQSFEKSHFGRILHGELLVGEQFQG